MTRYLVTGLFKLFLAAVAPAYLIGAALVFLPEDRKNTWRKRVVIAFFATVEAAILIDKGRPFFWGNIYGMASMDPQLAVHLLIGLAADAAWIAWTWRRAPAVAGSLKKIFSIDKKKAQALK
ncbi:MAG: hypothetical protein M5R36_27215 [Deltaproteobacteria bacterium]|nr:hypothetical protein [Deltaproteobacteria bacterium]